ncbi:hypothetical protein FRC17_000711 [Serendipita sp. 399]|nr:hypothetical protein FRC17_000711 [Serendipita sp. 399]
MFILPGFIHTRTRSHETHAWPWVIGLQVSRLWEGVLKTGCIHASPKEWSESKGAKQGEEYELVEIPPEQRKTSGYWDASRGWDPAGAPNGEGTPGEPLEADEISAQDLHSALQEMGEFHGILRDTVANLLSSSGNNRVSPHGQNGQISSAMAPMPFDSTGPTSTSVDLDASERLASSSRGPTQEVAAEIFNPFSDIFPELDFRGLGLDLQQLMSVDQIVEQASASALTLAEREAGLDMTGSASGSVNGDI